MSYRFEGSYGQPGSNTPGAQRTTKVNGTKGVMHAVRAAKRAEAETRNANTPPQRRRAYARSQGFSRVSQMLRELTIRDALGES